MVDIVAWPPVASIARGFTLDQPAGRDESVITGEAFVSVTQAARRLGVVEVSGAGCHGTSGGYVEMFKQALRGGLNLTRVTITASAWYREILPLRGLRGQYDVTWRNASGAVTWENDDGEVRWVAGVALTGVAGTIAGAHYIEVSGLPPSRIVAWPSEAVQTTSLGGTVALAHVLRTAHSDADGVARIFVDAALVSGAVIIGFAETGVFEVTNLSTIRPVQPRFGDWTVTFDLREVLPGERRLVGAVEVNPW